MSTKVQVPTDLNAKESNHHNHDPAHDQGKRAEADEPQSRSNRGGTVVVAGLNDGRPKGISDEMVNEQREGMSYRPSWCRGGAAR